MINLTSSLSANQLEYLLLYSKTFYERSLQEENILEKWKKPNFRHSLIDLVEKVKIWQSNGVDKIEFEIVNNQDFSNEDERVYKEAQTFLMFIALGIKGILEYMERDKEMATTLVQELYSSLPAYKNLFDEINDRIISKNDRLETPIICFHLSVSDDNFWDDDYY